MNFRKVPGQQELKIKHLMHAIHGSQIRTLCQLCRVNVFVTGVLMEGDVIVLTLSIFAVSGSDNGKSTRFVPVGSFFLKTRNFKSLLCSGDPTLTFKQFYRPHPLTLQNNPNKSSFAVPIFLFSSRGSAFLGHI